MRRLKVTMIGTYRKNPEKLKSCFDELKKQHNIISPSSVDFINPDQEFVRDRTQMHKTVYFIESGILDSISQSDFVWLFAPDGYIGLSGSFEIGHAHSVGIPVYTDTVIKDEMLNTMVIKVKNISNVKQSS